MSASVHPRRWRRTAAACAGLALAAPAFAQQADGPQLLPSGGCSSCARPATAAQGAATQSAPAAPAPASPRFRLEGLRFTGVQALGQDVLAPLAQPYVGRQVDLADLETLAKAVTQAYHNAGYFLAQALVPVQTVQDGVVEISVVEGRMGRLEVIVAPDAPITEARVRAFLAALVPGQALQAQVYERAMLLLSDQPGLRVSSALEEGIEPGTTDLTVEVAAGPRWSLSAEADNQGTKELGRYRAGGTLRLLSPFGIGDNLDVRALVSNGTGLQYGRVAYEAPIGASGLRAGIGLARVGYELGGSFAQLDARGTANVVDASLNYPLIRQRQQNLFLRLSADHKDLTDEFRALSFEARKRVQGLGLGWTWERRDDLFGGGYLASTGNLYVGRLDILDAQSLAFDQSAAGHGTDGRFAKLTLTLSRLQSITERQSLYLSAGVQRSSGNLDPSERLALGGARAVRAYAAGEALVDQGAIGTVEWRWAYTDAITPFLFYDAAHGRLVRRPNAFDGANGVSLRGYGIGLAWAQPSNFSLNATLAWRDTAPGITDGGERKPRLYVQLQKVFR